MDTVEGCREWEPSAVFCFSLPEFSEFPEQRQQTGFGLGTLALGIGGANCWAVASHLTQIPVMAQKPFTRKSACRSATATSHSQSSPNTLRKISKSGAPMMPLLSMS